MTELGGSQIAAVWSEKGQVELYNLHQALVAVSDSEMMAAFLREEQAKIKPIFSFAGHMTEGFAMDWSPKKPGTRNRECRGYRMSLALPRKREALKAVELQFKILCVIGFRYSSNW